jgi:hypothetical protein
MRVLFLRSRLDTHALSTSFHPDARRAPTAVRRSTFGVLNSAPNRRLTQLDTNVRCTVHSPYPDKGGG